MIKASHTITIPSTILRVGNTPLLSISPSCETRCVCMCVYVCGGGCDYSHNTA